VCARKQLDSRNAKEKYGCVTVAPHCDMVG